MIFATVGCGAPPSPHPCVVDGGFARRFRVTRLILPTMRTDFAVDLNGDQKLDDQTGNIVGALVAENMDPQKVVDQAFADGSQQMFLEVDSSQRGRADAEGVGVTVSEPGFAQPGVFCGDLQGGAFVPPSLHDTVVPVGLTLTLAFLDNLRAPLTAGQVSFTDDGAGNLRGQINGALRESDRARLLPPTIATLLMKKIANDPTANIARQILDLFDNGGNDDPAHPSGCRNALDGTPSCRNLVGPDAGSCAQTKDQKISACEVSTNSIVKNVLAPDVQLFSDDGSTYAPNPKNTRKDSLSFGVGFTAVAD